MTTTEPPWQPRATRVAYRCENWCTRYISAELGGMDVCQTTLGRVNGIRVNIWRGSDSDAKVELDIDTSIRVDQNQLTPVHAAALGALLTNASRIAGGTDR